MIQQDEIQNTIREFILQQFPTARKRGIGDDESLLEQGVIDSLGVLEIVKFIESQFEITLSDEEMVADHFDSIPAMARLVCAKLGME